MQLAVAATQRVFESLMDVHRQTDRQTDKQTLLPKLTAAARQRVSDPMDLDAVIALPEEEDIVLEGLISKKSRTRDSDGGWQLRRAILTEEELIWTHVNGSDALDKIPLHEITQIEPLVRPESLGISHNSSGRKAGTLDASTHLNTLSSGRPKEP